MKLAHLLRTNLLVASMLALGAAACSSSSEAPEQSVSNVESSTDASAPTTPSMPTVGTPGSHVSVHGMNLFGSEKLYLSHIPLYGGPHNLQVVVEVGITAGVPVESQKFGTQGFTIQPRAFSLSDLANGTLRNITATIFVGNFESGGRPIFRNVSFEVKRVIFRRLLTPTMGRSSTLDYIAVGTPTEPFLVHLIDAPPSFEQVLAVTLPANSFLSAGSLETGTLVSIQDSVNAITARLSSSDSVSASTIGASTNEEPKVPTATSTDGSAPSEADATAPATDAGPAPVSSAITVKGELTCLPGNDFFGNCPAPL